MQFKSPELAVQYARVNPTLKEFIIEFEQFCKDSSFPEPMATHILRTRDQQEDIYWRIIYTQAKGAFTEAGAKNQARHKWTWHFVLCAIDLRDYIYDDQQLPVVLAWLAKKTKDDAKWEYLYHDVGRGKHLHIGIRDNVWAKTIPIT